MHDTVHSDADPPAAAVADGRRSIERSFRDDIQGLRAVAVLSVVLYHADQRLAPGGFVGVDVFFVISGFLITGILLNELHRGEFSIAGFYQRRIRRLFPALFVMLAACLAAGAVLLTPFDYGELGRTTISTVFFASNFDFMRLSGYFDGGAEFKPLLHTWSLAVEEQFYIVFPLFLALVWTTARRWLVPILAATAALSLLASIWCLHHQPTWAFYLAPPRAFELLIGAMTSLAAAPRRLPQRWRDVLSLAGLALILGPVAFYTSTTRFPGLAALPPCLGTALVIYAGAGGATLGGRLLSLRPLPFFGALSYSLYLWHWPFLVFGRHYVHGELTQPQAALLVLGAVVAATLSLTFVERPAVKLRLPRRRVFALGGGAMACASAVAALVLASGGEPARFSPRALALFDAAKDHNPRREQCHADEGRPIAYAQDCVFGAPGAAPIVAVWGDSHGAELVVALGERMARRGQAILQITSSACPPALGYQAPGHPSCAAHNSATLKSLLGDDRIRTVVMAADYISYPLADRARLFDSVSASVQALVAGEKRVVLVYPFPEMPSSPPTTLGFMANGGKDLAAFGLPAADYARGDTPIASFLDALARRTGAVAFRPAEVLCGRSFCPGYLANAGVLYFNESHLSMTGARVAIRQFPFQVFDGDGRRQADDPAKACGHSPCRHAASRRLFGMARRISWRHQGRASP
jgi:peptidoglycan/LPS O-acetylase OafA/YrhL